MRRLPPRDDPFRATAAPVRRRVLDRLADGPHSAGDLAAAVALSPSALSQHLTILKGADLVRAERVGRSRIYHLHATPLADIATWVARYEVFWDERLGALQSLLQTLEDPEP